MRNSRQALAYSPSSDEQRHIENIVRNIRRSAAWQLKKAALDYSKVHTSWTPGTIILAEPRKAMPCTIVLAQASSHGA